MRVSPRRRCARGASLRVLGPRAMLQRQRLPVSPPGEDRVVGTLIVVVLGRCGDVLIARGSVNACVAQGVCVTSNLPAGIAPWDPLQCSLAVRTSRHTYLCSRLRLWCDKVHNARTNLQIKFRTEVVSDAVHTSCCDAYLFQKEVRGAGMQYVLCVDKLA